MADDLIEKYLGNEAELPEQNSSEFLEGLFKEGENPSDVLNKVKRVVSSYRASRDIC